MSQVSRSVLETSTAAFKQQFREYLRVLATDNDSYRVELITALEWCFDRWEYWRQKFYPEADLMFPFFQSAKSGSEFGHYSTCGASGQPSVIHIKRSFLMGTSDITVCKLSKTEKLVLKRDHPDRLKFVDQTILHELVHQYLHEASPDRAIYEASESGRSNHKGHGKLFAAECNRINQILHPELGFEFVPVRHVKRDRGPLADRQRPSCAQFTHGELFFAWDFWSHDLTDEQIEENRRRLDQALEFYGESVVLVTEEEEPENEFLAPYGADCADTCIDRLRCYDKRNGTNLLQHFLVAASKAHRSMVHDQLCAIEAEAMNISPAEGSEVVPATGDSFLTLSDEYPLSDPSRSLVRLNHDIRESGLTKTEFAQQTFGHKNGQQLSRHLKNLNKKFEQMVAQTLGAA